MLTAGSILIVDDEEGFRRSTAELFRRDGYACDCACDADDALEKLNTALIVTLPNASSFTG
jgi:CheY-like chemotaxis protein